MTGAELVRWERLRARREAQLWSSRWVWAAVGGALLAAFVGWRGAGAVAGGSGSHAWLAGALAISAVAFMRVPFHLYWRADAALLAQLPIGGDALFAAAFARCVRAGMAVLVACALGALPLFRTLSVELAVRHLALAGALGLATACLLPAVALAAAMVVAAGDRVTDATTLPRGSEGAVLGALPGFASAAVIVMIVLIAPWLGGGEPALPAAPMIVALAAASVAAIALVRSAAGRVMGVVLRDVSALDRQRLATLEIREPTAIERGVAALLGPASLPYRKDARLMRRRYPMAFALGGVIFLVLAIVGLAQPDDPAPWLAGALIGGALYGAALANRLRRPPIELPRLSATLPISPRARALAKIAWTLAWLAIFVGAPAAFALARTL